jgi:hypothetical protein
VLTLAEIAPTPSLPGMPQVKAKADWLKTKARQKENKSNRVFFMCKIMQ